MKISEEFIHNLAKEGAKKPFENPYLLGTKWFLLLTIYFAALVLFYGHRSDLLEKINQPAFLIEIIFLILTVITATFAASFLALPDLNQKPYIRFLPLIPLAFLSLMLIYGIFNFSTISFVECLKSGHSVCFTHLIFYSIIPALIMFWKVKKAAPIKFYWSGLMIGLAVASFGYLMLRLVEKSDEPELLLMWHFVPIFVIMIMGMIAGKILLKSNLFNKNYESKSI